MCMCIRMCVCSGHSQAFPDSLPYPSSLKVPQRTMGRNLSQRLKMPVPFGTPQTGCLTGFFMTRCSGHLQHAFIHVVMGDEDKPNHDICVPLDSKSEKMIRLGFMLHNGVTFNQTGAAEPSARAVIINAASSKEEREILRP